MKRIKYMWATCKCILLNNNQMVSMFCGNEKLYTLYSDFLRSSVFFTSKLRRGHFSTAGHFCSCLTWRKTTYGSFFLQKNPIILKLGGHHSMSKNGPKSFPSGSLFILLYTGTQKHYYWFEIRLKPLLGIFEKPVKPN